MMQAMQAECGKQSKQWEVIYQEITCPISGQVFRDPVFVCTGHTFERAMIEDWFQKGNTSNPCTGLPLANLNLSPNIIIKTMIEKLPDMVKKVEKEKKDAMEISRAVEEMIKHNMSNHDIIYAEAAEQIEDLKIGLTAKTQECLLEKFNHEKDIKQIKETLEKQQLKHADVVKQLEAAKQELKNNKLEEQKLRSELQAVKKQLQQKNEQSKSSEEIIQHLLQQMEQPQQLKKTISQKTKRISKAPKLQQK